MVPLNSFLGGIMNKGLFYLLMGLTSTTALNENNSSIGVQNVSSQVCNTVAIGKTDGIPVYENNNLESQIIDYLNTGESVQTGNEVNGFVEIESGDVIGWIESDKLVCGDDIADVAKSLGIVSHLVAKYNSSKIYSEPDLLSTKIDNTLKYETYTDFGQQGDFYKIKVNGGYGFVSTASVELEYEFRSMSATEDSEDSDEDCVYYADNGSLDLYADWSADYSFASSDTDNVNTTATGVATDYSYLITNNDADSAIAGSLVEKALTYVGGRYVWGGTSLEYGVDCSGFTQQIFKLFGYNLPRTSRSQAKTGIEVTPAELQPGDLVFYSKKGVINHVALYVGDGLIVHASNSRPYPKGGIKVSKVFYREPATIRRILK